MILKQMSQLSGGSSGLCPAHYGFLPGAMPNYIPTFGGLPMSKTPLHQAPPCTSLAPQGQATHHDGGDFSKTPVNVDTADTSTGHWWTQQHGCTGKRHAQHRMCFLPSLPGPAWTHSQSHPARGLCTHRWGLNAKDQSQPRPRPRAHPERTTAKPSRKDLFIVNR